MSKAVARGRLHDSVVRDERGAPKIADPGLADREWEANTRQRADHAPRAAESASSARAAAPAPPQSEDPPAAARRGTRTDLPDGVPPYAVSQAVRAQAAARREVAAADQAELELAARRGRLVDAETARADVEQAYSLVKTRLLRVPSAVAQQLPDLAARVVPVLEALIGEALQELSSDG